MATKDKAATAAPAQTPEELEEDLFAGMSPEDIKALLDLTGQSTNMAFDKTPVLKVNKFPIKDAKGNKVEMGNFVIGQVTRQEGRNTIIEDIGIDCGANPEITVLKFGSKFSYFPDMQKGGEKKDICQSQLVLDVGDRATGDNLGFDCASGKCFRRGKDVDKAQKCSCQFAAFIEVKVGEETMRAMMYFKGTSFIPFKNYIDSAGKYPLFFYPTTLTTEQQVNGTNVYWIITPVLEKLRPYPVAERVALMNTAKKIDTQVREFEGNRKLLAASRQEAERKQLPPGMSVQPSGNVPVGTERTVSGDDTEEADIVF